MTSPARTLLSDLPKDHRFPTAQVRLTEQDVDRYLDAVGDGNALYRQRGLAPPLAAAARSLGAVLDAVELPAGALHTGQELDVRAGIPIGATLTLRARVAQRSERAGLVISVIEFDLTPEGASEPAVIGRTTVLVVPAVV